VTEKIWQKPSLWLSLGCHETWHWRCGKLLDNVSNEAKAVKYDILRNGNYDQFDRKTQFGTLTIQLLQIVTLRHVRH
jgi:hypothetical protein